MRTSTSYAYLVIFFLIGVKFSVAQTSKIEVLKQRLVNAKTETEKADLNFQLAELLYSYSFDEGYKYADEAFRISENGFYEKGKVQALTSLGNYYYYKGENQKSLELYHQAVTLARKLSLHDFLARTYLRLSIYYRQQAYFDSAQLYLNKIKDLLPVDEKSSMLASYYASAGILANDLSRNDTALLLLKKSIAIRSTVGDTIRLADTWRNLGAVYTDLSMYDSAEYCFVNAMHLLEKDGNPEVLMLLDLSRGETAFVRGNYNEAIENYNKALDKLKENNYKRYYAYLLYKIGELYENQGAYHIAYEYLFKSLKEFEAINSQQDMAKAYSQIGWCYNFQKNYTLAVENANKSLGIATQIGDSASIAQNKNLIGYSLLKTGKLNDALLNFQEALNIRKRIKNWWGASFTLFNMALVHIEMNDSKEGFDLLFESLDINKRIGNKGGIVFTCNEIGLQYIRQKQFAKAEYYLKQAQVLANEIPLPAQLIANYKNFILLFETKNDDRKTVQYFKLYTTLKDSLDNELNSSRMATSDALFQLQKKANEILLVNKENELSQEKIKNQQVEIVFQRRIILLVVLGLAILTVLILIIYRLLKSRTKAKELLRKQFVEISEQKEEIQSQSEELTEANETLKILNNELTEKNVEIELQSEKIHESNISLEKRVEERTSQLNTAYSELETFFYKTSHDFRRPLTTYLGLVEIAKASVKDSQAIDLFEKVKETTMGLDRMLIKLQSISAIDYESSNTEISVSDLITHSLEKFKYSIEAKDIKITIENSAEKITTNEYLCRIFLESIIENSVDYCTPINPTLRIVTSQSADKFTIIIEDNGQGIPATIQHRIFEMYFRGNDNSRGNGLGLYIAKRAIDKLGGTISFISRLHEGTSFKITLSNKS